MIAIPIVNRTVVSSTGRHTNAVRVQSGAPGSGAASSGLLTSTGTKETPMHIRPIDTERPGLHLRRHHCVMRTCAPTPTTVDTTNTAAMDSVSPETRCASKGSSR
nr:hypothetical protein [Saccharopolyspora spinosa]